MSPAVSDDYFAHIRRLAAAIRAIYSKSLSGAGLGRSQSLPGAIAYEDYFLGVKVNRQVFPCLSFFLPHTTFFNSASSFNLTRS